MEGSVYTICISFDIFAHNFQILFKILFAFNKNDYLIFDHLEFYFLGDRSSFKLHNFVSSYFCGFLCFL